MNFSHIKESKLGLIIISFLFLFIFIWMIFFKVDLVIKAPGQVIVKTYKKTVKHTRGGIVDKLYVKEGDYVKKNQNLIKLDTKENEFKLYAAKSELNQLQIEKKRILSQLNKSKFTTDLNNSYDILQYNIYNNQIKNLLQQIKKLQIQINEKKAGNEALKAKIEANKKTLKTYKDELNEWSKLYKKNLVNKIKILDIQRKIYNTQGEINQDTYQIQKNKEKIKELSNQIKITKSNYKKELLKRENEIETKIPKLTAQINSYKDIIAKSYIKAPSQGYVTELNIHSPGEIISPQKEIMFIVPKENEYIIEAKVSPLDIEKVKLNEKAEINFNAYVDPSAKPVYGKVIYISADSIKDKNNPKISYYKVQIKLTPEGLKAIKENHFQLIPGMPVTAFIHTKKVSVMSYLLYPVVQMFKGAFYAN